MALTNPKIFGLNIKTELADIRDKNTALLNLGLNPLDLEIIKGSSNAGMTRYDWFSFSRLKEPIHKRLSRFESECRIFDSILINRAGTDQTLFGNLDINGSLSGSSIRYRFLDGTNPGKLADISTSRVSAWSSSDPRANNNDLSIQKLAKISYGARVSIISGGQLQFEPQSGNVSGARLQTSSTPEVKEFDSEVPTSKIRCNINGKEVFLYAMKGIPLTFKGFFRNLNAKVNINYSSGGSIPASWKIVETANENRFVNFKNIGTGESSIAFRSPVSRERFIKFYYNPKHITQVQIRSANIRELPPTKLENCTELDFAYNQLKIFPNIAFIAPKLNTLSLMRNPFYLSDNEFERKFNNLVADKLKTTSGTGGHSSIRTLNMEGTFPGSIERHLISSKLPNLTSLNFGRGGGVNFHPDDRPDSGLTNNRGDEAFCPDVPNGVSNYSIQYNDFRSVDLNSIDPTDPSPTVAITDPSDGSISTGTTSLPNGSYSYRRALNLTNLNVYGNYYLDETHTGGNYDLSSKDKLVNINMGGTNLAIPNMQGATALESFNQTYGRGGQINKLVNTGGVYLFENCNALKTLNFYATNLGEINFPLNGFTNTNLTYLDLRYTSIKGGVEGDESEVIKQNTFSSCPNLEYIYIDSNKLLAQEINFNAFKLNSNLIALNLRSYDRVNGILPDFSGNPSLRSLFLSRNNFTGALPNFGSNQNINYVNITHNAFTGQIPAFLNLSNLRQLELNNNAFTSIGEPSNLPNLYYYYAHNNQLAGEIPDFTTCTNLRYLTLYNNQLSAYKVGSFKSLYRIRYFDLSNNNLNQTAQDNIISDLFDNWNAIKRGGVTINLRGNKNNIGVNETPSDEAKEKALILVANGWNVSVNGGLT
jgi:Leucine-rich repeat (LRR) protein